MALETWQLPHLATMIGATSLEKLTESWAQVTEQLRTEPLKQTSAKNVTLIELNKTELHRNKPLLNMISQPTQFD